MFYFIGGAFPYGLSTADSVGVACCGKGEKAYWDSFFFFSAETANLIFGKCTKKRCSGFWIEVLSLSCFLAGRAKKLYLVYCIAIVFTAVLGLKNLHVAYTCIRFLKTFFPLGFVCFIF